MGSGLPSTLRRALCPTCSCSDSAAPTEASSSSLDKSTISTMRASTAARSPGCVRRCAIWPLIGARNTPSSSDLRAMSTAACAARYSACALASADVDDSSAVLEIKPCSTSARLLSKLRCATSIWVLLDSACCWACCRRGPASLFSMRPMTCPAFTKSPSRTCRPCTSPATRAFTNAALLALIAPETGTPTASVWFCKVSTSAAASTVGGATLADSVWASALARSVWRLSTTRYAPAATASTTSPPTSQP